MPLVVVIEAWNLLARKDKTLRSANRMLLWLNTPGNVVLIAKDDCKVNDAVELIIRHGIDIVDAMLALLATDISEKCGLRQAVHVATYDTRDFAKLKAHRGVRLQVYDMKEMSPTYYQR